MRAIKLLPNGCMISDTCYFPEKLSLLNGDVYKLVRRCSTEDCYNHRHVSYYLSEHLGEEVQSKSPYPSHRKGRDKTAHLEYLKDHPEKVMESYIRLGSWQKVSRELEVSNTFLRRHFRDISLEQLRD